MPQVTASQMNPPGESLTQLILTDSENDRVRWVSALQELHKVLKKNQELSKMVSWGIQYFSLINNKLQYCSLLSIFLPDSWNNLIQHTAFCQYFLSIIFNIFFAASLPSKGGHSFRIESSDKTGSLCNDY